ncbi:MAG: 4-alpha-glucanotransferase [Alphaproteobacteria bacterium]|nr:4-alpha-glucanotransferase [Alphaproteobacteria bacterium]
MAYVCIHAHLYQPSREDPWTGVWPVEPGAAPFRNWNERITAECYAPNAAARLLDTDGRLRGVRSTYRDISFDVGPTLLQWLERNAPVVYAAILRADAASRRWQGGHGSAMAQGYHHAILPLCDARDRRTEIAWGLRDFELRYGRKTEGFWLPEAAVDLDSLDVLAAHGVRFVVLAPTQIRRVRPEGADQWVDAAGVPSLSRRAYRVALREGRSIAVLPYDAEASQGVAFGGWLFDGAAMGRKLADLAVRSRDPRALLHLATDGESYGHHHRRGEMALARALEVLEADSRVELVTYGRYLDLVPPTWDAEIHELTSWSCAHGVERWRSDCPCGNDPAQHHRWRAPLRAAFDSLRDAAREVMAPVARRVFRDVDAARDAYVELLHDHAPDAVAAWLRTHGGKASLTAADQRAAHAILEIERHLLAMYTSCAWFFDDVTGIEARQDLRHAACALGLLQAELDADLSAPFLARVAAFPGNHPVDELVELVEHHRHRPPPVRAPHAASALTALADEGDTDAAEVQGAAARFGRAAGLLCHVTSLPGGGPIGDLDGVAPFVDWMCEAGLSIWQILPLGPTDDGGSPYSSWASFCGNPLVIGIQPLVDAGLLTPGEASTAPEGPLGSIDPAAARAWKLRAVELAAQRLLANAGHRWHDDAQRWAATTPWVRDAARFKALKERFDDAPWWRWPEAVRRADPEAVEAALRDRQDQVARFGVVQYFFDRQWFAARSYCTARGVRLLGDLPIYVGEDSADVWAAQDRFRLDDDGRPIAVAGVPPDAFSETGQRWGNPLYAWDRMAADGFGWWIARMRRTLEQTDLVRLDHFVGFVNFWEVPAHDEDARAGRWRPGPGRALFDALEAALGTLPLVVEDLGVVGAEVRALQEALGQPGMRVVQFGFDGNPRNLHLPWNHPEHAVAYVGTHDNDTAVGWWNHLTPNARRVVRHAFPEPAGQPHAQLTELLLRSRAVWAILTPQDLLGLGSEARMNVPGIADGNWRWRLRPDQLDAALATTTRARVAQAGRLAPGAR